jgi:ketosteroid isomerase-like protein
MSQENVEVVRRLIAALSERDAEGYIALCAADVQMVSPVAAIEGTTVGAEGIRQFFSGLKEAWSEFHMDVERIQAVGDSQVLALMNMSGVSEGGIPIAQPLSSVYDLAAGRLRRVHVYLDRSDALKAVGLED